MDPLRAAAIRVLSAARCEGEPGKWAEEFRAAMTALEEALQPLRVEDLLDGLDQQWNLIRLAAGLFIAWAIPTAYFMGRVLACLESIAKSLREIGGGK